MPVLMVFLVYWLRLVFVSVWPLEVTKTFVPRRDFDSKCTRWGGQKGKATSTTDMAQRALAVYFVLLFLRHVNL